MSDIELFAENELTLIETEERAFHERVIHDAERGKKKLTEIQLASLKVLFDQKLYRNTHKTFPEYCKATFDFEKAYSYYQIGFAQVTENLSTRVDFLPATEGQARPLAALKSPELQAQAWTQAQADSGKEQPSNREVAEAVAKIQAELETEKKRSEEFRTESNERRKRIRELEAQIGLLESKPAEIQVQKPADYEAAKAKAAELERELANVKTQQDRIIQSAIKDKLKGYQGEVDALEAKKRNLEQQAKEYQEYLASLTGKAKQMEAQARAFEKSRQALVDLASELADFSPVDPDLSRKALALAEMHGEAMRGLQEVFGEHRPELTVIHGDAA